MNIVTALMNPEINKKLKEEANFKIIGNDIIYQEGIIEILERDKKIDLIIISELIPGEHSFKEIIDKIKQINKKIEIIVILKEKNEKIKNYLISKGIFSIFYNNEITIEELIKIINEKNNIKKENEINEEIQILKKIILENNKKNKNVKKYNKKFKNIFYYIKNKINKNKKIKNNKNVSENKIISIVGINGVGKSIFCSTFAKIIRNKKILLIDFDIFNQSINTFFGKKRKTNKKENNVYKLIIKENKTIDLLCATEILFNEKYKIEKNKIKNTLEKLKEKYDLILIDTTSECFFDYTKEILEKSNLIVFLIEPNLSEMKKSRNLLDIYINKWKINREKINIVFNKQNSNSIDNSILKILFEDFNVLGKIKLNSRYNFLINNNLKIIDKKIKKEYLKIIENCNLNE